MKPRMTLKTRKDSGTAGDKLRLNIKTIQDQGEMLKWLLPQLAPDKQDIFRAYFGDRKWRDIEGGRWAAVGPTTYALGELSAAINIALRIVGYPDYYTALMSFGKRAQQ